jgi:hypothetical protein
MFNTAELKQALLVDPRALMVKLQRSVDPSKYGEAFSAISACANRLYEQIQEGVTDPRSIPEAMSQQINALRRDKCFNGGGMLALGLLFFGLGAAYIRSARDIEVKLSVASLVIGAAMTLIALCLVESALNFRPKAGLDLVKERLSSNLFDVVRCLSKGGFLPSEVTLGELDVSEEVNVHVREIFRAPPASQSNSACSMWCRADAASGRDDTTVMQLV